MLALASCGATLDQASAARQIARRLSAQFAIPPPRVTCPKGVAATAGQSFHCTVRLAGHQVGVDAKVTGAGGSFDVVSLTRVVLATSRTTRTLAHEVSAKTGSPTSVHCATAGVIVVEKGERLSCTASQGGVSRPLKVLFVDSKGDLTYSLG